MGKEFVVNSLEDMCALMCDNNTEGLEVIDTSKIITVPVYNCELEEYEEVRMTIKEFLENCATEESED